MLRHPPSCSGRGDGPEQMKRMQIGVGLHEVHRRRAGCHRLRLGPAGGSLPSLRHQALGADAPAGAPAASGPPSSFDVALHLDFADEAGLEAYNKDDVHHEVAVYNAEVSQGSSRPGSTGGTTAMPPDNAWPGVTTRCSCGRTRSRKTGREPPSTRCAGSRTPPELSGDVGTGVGSLKTDFDWILDVQLRDAEAAERLMAGRSTRRRCGSSLRLPSTSGPLASPT